MKLLLLRLCYVRESTNEVRILSRMLGPLSTPSRRFNTFSTTLNSVAVVSRPQKADQSFTTNPAPITALPRFTVPAATGTCNKDESSCCSSTDVFGCKRAPPLDRAQYDPTRVLPAIPCRKTSTSSVSRNSCSVSCWTL